MLYFVLQFLSIITKNVEVWLIFAYTYLILKQRQNE